MWLPWLIVGIVFTVAEIIYTGFFLMWFGISGFLTMLLSFAVPNPFIQILFFLILSVILVLTLTKRLTEYFSSSNHFVSNIDKLIGKEGLVIKSIGSNPTENGLVKLDGETWTAVSTKHTAIQKGCLVRIDAIKGVRLFVTEISNH